MNDLPIVHGMWIGNRLSAMELLTIRSYTGCGYAFHLWAYDEINNLPDSVVLHQAAEIIPRREVFSYRHANKFGHGKGSYAGFSDIFRYKLLYEHGGIWTDMDMTCLQPIPAKSSYQFRFHKKTGVVGNFLQCPAKSDLMKWCYEKAMASMHPDSTNWMLPIEILNQGLRKYDPDAHIVKDTNEDSFPEVAFFLKPGSKLPGNWMLMHWMNEEFRRLKIPKDACLEGSAFHQACLKWEIPVTVVGGREAMSYRWKTSRFNYLGVNLRARLKWLIG